MPSGGGIRVGVKKWHLRHFRNNKWHPKSKWKFCPHLSFLSIHIKHRMLANYKCVRSTLEGFKSCPQMLDSASCRIVSFDPIWETLLALGYTVLLFNRSLDLDSPIRIGLFLLWRSVACSVWPENGIKFRLIFRKSGKK
jgi:hypothetical protein